MSFKLAFKNMKKNTKDYVIYFLTLILGVAVFYIFNSMDGQQAMLQISESKRVMIDSMIQVLGVLSVFISIVLAFLIMYANNFLIKRRNKEFGLYMLLGMGKKQISWILLLETLLIGILSLGIGLAVGVLGSQLMSVLVAKLFAADMTEFKFVFSSSALIKTIVYFGVIYIAVIIINLIKTSKYKLIELITSDRKNEKVKIKNTAVSVILFIISVIILSVAYYLAVNSVAPDGNLSDLITATMMGIVATFLFFYSLSGFILKVVKSFNSIYMKNLNMFVVKQIDSKINSTVFSMSIICLLLFFTICIFSSAISLNNSMTSQLEENTPCDVIIRKYSDVSGKASEKVKNDAKITIEQTLKNKNFDIDKNFSSYEEISQYDTPELTFEDTIGENVLKEVKTEYPNLLTDQKETIIKLSDYNKLARLYGRETLSLQADEYVILCNYDLMKNIRDKALKEGHVINLNGKQLKPKFSECYTKGIVEMAPQPQEVGKIIVPDNCVKEEWKCMQMLSANYMGYTNEEKQKIEDYIDSSSLVENTAISNIMTKIYIYDSSIGVATVATFIGLYLGIIFLISSAAILALKELSDSSDNKERYRVLRKIGVDEKMINKAVFKQTAIFFLIPLLLACVHSIFGMQVANGILSIFGKQDLITSIIMTAGFIILIYGGYFIATYFGNKSIIKE